ncbi:unnamed protein product [Peniophora sp. CBMAI 1063]|nr:unnamed protein product [Peniophora sp. CBMAI 1063]
MSSPSNSPVQSVQVDPSIPSVFLHKRKRICVEEDKESVREVKPFHNVVDITTIASQAVSNAPTTSHRIAICPLAPEHMHSPTPSSSSDPAQTQTLAHQHSRTSSPAIYARAIYSDLPASLHPLLIQPSPHQHAEENPPQALDVPLTEDILAGFIETRVARALSTTSTSTTPLTRQGSSSSTSMDLYSTSEDVDGEPLFYQELCAHKTLQNACVQAQAAGEDIISQSSYMHPGADTSEVPSLLERATRAAVAPYESACADVEHRISVARDRDERARSPLDGLPALFDSELAIESSTRPANEGLERRDDERSFIPCGLTDTCGEPLFDAASARAHFALAHTLEAEWGAETQTCDWFGCGATLLVSCFEQHILREHVVEPLLRGEGEVADDLDDEDDDLNSGEV